MRRKRSRRQPAATERPTAAREPTADWIVENEVGWGLPHPTIAVIAGLFVAWKALRFAVGRLAARSEEPRRP